MKLTIGALEIERFETAEIGVMFREPDEHMMMSSITTIVMLELAFTHDRLETLVSDVRPDNLRALRLNRSLRAWEVPSNKPEVMRFTLSNTVARQNRLYQRVRPRIILQMQMNGPLVEF